MIRIGHWIYWIFCLKFGCNIPILDAIFQTIIYHLSNVKEIRIAFFLNTLKVEVSSQKTWSLWVEDLIFTTLQCYNVCIRWLGLGTCYIEYTLFQVSIHFGYNVCLSFIIFVFEVVDSLILNKRRIWNFVDANAAMVTNATNASFIVNKSNRPHVVRDVCCKTL